jgi:hypothetical protein
MSIVWAYYVVACAVAIYAAVVGGHQGSYAILLALILWLKGDVIKLERRSLGEK